jgi:5-formyltetrahydrofolate cyclo-ligase
MHANLAIGRRRPCAAADNGDVAVTKAQLRRELGAARRARPAGEMDADRSAIRRHVLDACAARGWRSVAAYVPFGTEPGSVELLEELRGSGRRVLVPLTLADRDLDWAEWTDGGAGDALGREAVATVEVALVPALAVAKDGTRLGRGGGSYDRALARMRPTVPVVALLYDGELLAELPRDPWDRPVSAVVTPSGWHDVG